MDISRLTASGWFLLAVCILISLSFIARLVVRDLAHLWFHVVTLAVCWTWLLYLLVTP